MAQLAMSYEDQLYRAARKGDYNAALGVIMKHSVNINTQLKGHKNSTALHAAAYSGYGKIVQLLVGMGCDRRIKNDYGLTAAQEAKSEKIKQLILYPKRGTSERFFITKQDLPAFNTDVDCLVGAHWIGYNNDDRQIVIKELNAIYPVFGKEAAQLVDAKKVDWCNAIIRMYTKESPLYKRMNNDIASWNKLTKLKHYARELCAALKHIQGTHKHKIWKGTCYRSVKLSEDKIGTFDKLNTYNKCFQLPSFSSCSKSKQLCLGWGGNALLVIIPDDGTGYPCTYATDISHLSVFPNEQEVLFHYY